LFSALRLREASLHDTPDDIRNHPGMSATTLVLAGAEGTARTGFEVRLPRARGGAGTVQARLQEDHAMSIEQQTKGKLDEAKGRAKQAQGDLTGDDAKKGEGVADEAKGKVRQAADRVREAAHDVTK
jgi:uncharacterized protein YjbJ (UPF0337 family)